MFFKALFSAVFWTTGPGVLTVGAASIRKSVANRCKSQLRQFTRAAIPGQGWRNSGGTRKAEISPPAPYYAACYPDRCRPSSASSFSWPPARRSAPRLPPRRCSRPCARRCSSRPIGSISAIRTSGKIEIFGLTGTVQEWDDVRNARFRQSQVAGAVDRLVRMGRQDRLEPGLRRPHDDRRRRVRAAAVDRPGVPRQPAVTCAPTRAAQRSCTPASERENGKTYDVLAVTPRFGTEMDLWIDPQSHLIEEETASIGVDLDDDRALELPPLRRHSVSVLGQHADLDGQQLRGQAFVARGQPRPRRPHARAALQRSRFRDRRRQQHDRSVADRRTTTSTSASCSTAAARTRSCSIAAAITS